MVVTHHPVTFFRFFKCCSIPIFETKLKNPVCSFSDVLSPGKVAYL